MVRVTQFTLECNHRRFCLTKALVLWLSLSSLDLITLPSSATTTTTTTTMKLIRIRYQGYDTHVNKVTTSVRSCRYSYKK